MNNRPTNWQSIRDERLRRDSYVCGNCGGTNELHVHHIVPLGKGGTNKQDNLKTLCKDCHHSIHHKEKLAPTHASARKTERRSGPPSFYAERRPEPSTDTAPKTEPIGSDEQVGLALLIFSGGMAGFGYAGYSLGGWWLLILGGLVGVPVMFLVSALITEKVYPPEPKYPK